MTDGFKIYVALLEEGAEVWRHVMAKQISIQGVPKAGLMLSSAEFYKNIAQEFAIPYEAAALSNILASRTLKSDTVHPNAQGYRKLAEALASLLKESGAI